MDWKNPDYPAILRSRGEKLTRIRAAETRGENPWPKLKAFYRDHPERLCTDWGMTFDPRRVETGESPTLPFILFSKQVDFMKWTTARWQSKERAVCEKSRECGVTWLTVAWGVAMWLFHPGFVVRYGSRKEIIVDRPGDMDSIFEKVRFFIEFLPRELQPEGWDPKKHNTHMKTLNPENGAALIGEAGNDIGRGGRSSIAFTDESAFLADARSVENALSQNTNCQIDVSTFKGSGNLFYEKVQRWSNTSRHFIFDWKDDPRKDQAWYDLQKENLPEETVAQEIDRDPHASESDSFIPAKWVAASIDAHLRLGFTGEGDRVTGFDPADVGDAKAVVHRHGSLVTGTKQRKLADITSALPWAFDEVDKARSTICMFDGDGMGAPSIKIYLERVTPRGFSVIAYHGSGAVRHPNRLTDSTSGRQYKKHDIHKVKGKRNRDTYLNFKAQSWGWVRRRFELTYEAVTRATNGLLVNINPEDLISISSECEDLIQLQAELSRPQRQWTTNGKIKVESKPDMRRRQVMSPNLAESLVMAYANSHKSESTSGARILFKEQGVMDQTVGY